jgi:electron transport complex protein RnfG
MSKFRDGPFGPTVILFLICGIIAVALVGTYQVTAPVIEQGEITAANEARKLVLPAGDSFTEVEGINLPDGVSEVYKADNDAGYVIRSAANGYGGPVTFMIGVGADGSVVAISLFSHSETPGLGTRVGEEAYLANYLGKVDPQTVDAITGATRTSNALKNALAQALSAYELAKTA